MRSILLAALAAVFMFGLVAPAPAAQYNVNFQTDANALGGWSSTCYASVFAPLAPGCSVNSGPAPSSVASLGAFQCASVSDNVSPVRYARKVDGSAGPFIVQASAPTITSSATGNETRQFLTGSGFEGMRTRRVWVLMTFDGGASYYWQKVIRMADGGGSSQLINGFNWNLCNSAGVG